MINQLHPKVYLVKNIFGKTNSIFAHIIENETKFQKIDGCCIGRYSVDPQDGCLSENFLAICFDYIKVIELAVESCFSIEVANKGNFIVGANIYDEGCSIGSHNDLYDENDKENNNSVSSVHFLNDNFTGGELVFTDIDISVSPQANCLVVFDSYLTHYTNPITSGRKVSCTRFWKNAHS